MAVDLKVPQLGVRHQLAIYEQGCAQPGAHRHQQHHALVALACPKGNFSQPGGIGIVDHVHRAAGGLGEQGGSIGAHPMFVHVCRGQRDPGPHHRRETAANWPIPIEVMDDLGDHLGHLAWLGRIGGGQAVAWSKHCAGGDIHRRSLDP